MVTTELLVETTGEFYCDFISPQCKKFRDKLTPEKRNILKEKLQASEVFKDKKSSYPLT